MTFSTVREKVKFIKVVLMTAKEKVGFIIFVRLPQAIAKGRAKFVKVVLGTTKYPRATTKEKVIILGRYLRKKWVFDGGN